LKARCQTEARLATASELAQAVEELMPRSADYFVELARRVVQAGVDIFLAADDFAIKTGLFVRPELFKQVWRPHYDRILAPARDAGIPIMFHSDGKIDDAAEKKPTW
jgi:hypothetical protein